MRIFTTAPPARKKKSEALSKCAFGATMVPMPSALGPWSGKSVITDRYLNPSRSDEKPDPDFFALCQDSHLIPAIIESPGDVALPGAVELDQSALGEILSRRGDLFQNVQILPLVPPRRV